MKLIRLLWRESPFQFMLAIVASLLTAALMLMLVSLLSHYLDGSHQKLANWWQFLLLSSATVVCQVGANGFISSLTHKITQHIRSHLVKTIANAQLASLERATPPALLTSLVDDTGRIADSLPGIVALVRDLTFMLVCFAYLGWLDFKPLLAIIAVILGGSVIHSFLQRRGSMHINNQRQKEQHLFSVLRNMVDGVKQIKLSNRRSVLLGHIDDTQHAISKLHTKSLMAFSVANAYAVLLFLLLLEILIFGEFSTFVNPQVLIAYTLTLMFLLGPLQNISNTTQQLRNAGVSLGRIQALEDTLEQERQPASLHSVGGKPALEADKAGGHWRSISLSGVTYQFETEDRQTFEVGPFNFSLTPGKVLFVIGGNGSGKTTFAKLISGLYAPTTGTIRMDDKEVTEENRTAYRQHFGAVFADFNLFEGLANTPHDPIVKDELTLLRQLKLDHIVDVDKGLFAQAATFSSGERRRAAMLMAYLDKRNIYVFDEFAADQDPECREMFYQEIIPRLKAQGKLIIVITHDSRFFASADEILELERGMTPVYRENLAGIAAVV